jgi:hypothetical protein
MLLRSLLERRSIEGTQHTSVPISREFLPDVCTTSSSIVEANIPSKAPSLRASALMTPMAHFGHIDGFSVPAPTSQPDIGDCTASSEQAESTHYCASALCSAYDRAPILVLHPLSRLRLYWDILVSICSLISLIEIPLRVAFDRNGFGYKAGTATAGMNWMLVVIFVLQPLVETRTIVLHRGTPEGRASTILHRYTHSPRIITDLLSACTPLLASFWLPLALIGFVRVITTLRFVHKLEKATKTSPTFVRSAQLIMGAFVSLHWIACLFCYLAHFPGSWYEFYHERAGHSDVATGGK